MQPKFKLGDIVILKSGNSPKMIINKINLKRYVTSDMRGFNDVFNGTYECKWFEKGNLASYTENFAEEALEIP